MKSMLKFAMFAAAMALMNLGLGVNANASITYSFDNNLVLYWRNLQITANTMMAKTTSPTIVGSIIAPAS